METLEELYEFYIETCDDETPLTFEDWKVNVGSDYSTMWEAVCELIPAPSKEDKE